MKSVQWADFPVTLFCALIGLCVLSAPLFGQKLTSVSGVVSDPSGAVVLHAKVVLGE
jgi:hypothetical protein